MDERSGKSRKPLKRKYKKQVQKQKKREERAARRKAHLQSIQFRKLIAEQDRHMKAIRHE